MGWVKFGFKFFVTAMAGLWLLFQVLQPYLTWVLFVSEKALNMLGYHPESVSLKPAPPSYDMEILYQGVPLRYDGGGMAANLVAFLALAVASTTETTFEKGRRIVVGLTVLAILHPVEVLVALVPQFTAAGPASAYTIGVINIALAFLVWAVLWRGEILERIVQDHMASSGASKKNTAEPIGEAENEENIQED